MTPHFDLIKIKLRTAALHSYKQRDLDSVYLVVGQGERSCILSTWSRVDASPQALSQGGKYEPQIVELLLSYTRIKLHNANFNSTRCYKHVSIFRRNMCLLNQTIVILFISTVLRSQQRSPSSCSVFRQRTSVPPHY